MTLSEFGRRLRFLLRRDRHTADLAEEMQLHLELRERRERERGAVPVDAPSRARRQFGNPAVLLEQSFDQWGIRWADDLGKDIRYGLRGLRRTPMTSAIVIGTLAVGIGASLGMFTIMDAALFRPLPVRDPDQLVIMPRRDVPLEGRRRRADPLDLNGLRTHRELYEEIGAFAAGGINIGDGAPMRAQAGLVTPSALRVIGVAPFAGRVFVDEEGQPGGGDVVVLSYRLWQAHFGGNRSVIGTRIQLNDRPYEVVGIMPPRFAFPEGSDLWIPLTIPLTPERVQIFHFIISTTYVARLAPGVTRAQANARFNAMAEAIYGKRNSTDAAPDAHLPLRNFLVGDSASRLFTTMGLAVMLLFTACLNVAGLLLARWGSRRREIAIRAAIGASRFRVLRQLGTESAILSVFGALFGLVLAAVALRFFDALMPPELAALAPPVVNQRVLILLLVLAIGATMVIGILPGLLASAGDLASSLKTGAALGGTYARSRRVGGALVVVEVAFAVVLLVGSGLLARSMQRLYAVKTGLRLEHVVTARVALSRNKYPTLANRQRFWQQLKLELGRQKGIEHSALTSTLPLRGQWNPTVAFDLIDRPDVTTSPFVETAYVSEDYFATMGIDVMAGRALVGSDSLLGGGAVITDSIARTFWHGTSALGARISAGGESQPRTVVGIVREVRGTSLAGDQNGQLYLPLTASFEATIVARSPLPTEEALAQVRAAVRFVEPTQVVFDEKSMQQVAADALRDRRVTSTLATIFGASTLLLATFGVYGLLSFGVGQRLPEIGIRFALGAQPLDVIRRVVLEGVRLVFIGTTCGIVIAWYAARALRPQLFGVTIAEPLVYCSVPAVLLVATLVAAFVPAARAAAVDPLRVLRSE